MPDDDSHEISDPAPDDPDAGGARYVLPEGVAGHEEGPMASNTRGASIGLGALLVVGLVTAILLTRCDGGDDGDARPVTVSSTPVAATTAPRISVDVNISDVPIRLWGGEGWRRPARMPRWVTSAHDDKWHSN